MLQRRALHALTAQIAQNDAAQSAISAPVAGARAAQVAHSVVVPTWMACCSVHERVAPGAKETQAPGSQSVCREGAFTGPKAVPASHLVQGSSLVAHGRALQGPGGGPRGLPEGLPGVPRGFLAFLPTWGRSLGRSGALRLLLRHRACSAGAAVVGPGGSPGGAAGPLGVSWGAA